MILINLLTLTNFIYVFTHIYNRAEHSRENQNTNTPFNMIESCDLFGNVDKFSSTVVTTYPLNNCNLEV